MDTPRTFTAFGGDRLLATGDLATVLRAAKGHLDSRPRAPLLIFNDESGAPVDFDFSGTADEVVRRAVPPPPTPGPGRPRLGVVSREVSLLPRHWDWLAGRRGGASATLRRLVDDARRNEGARERARRAADAAGRMMTVLAGDRPHFEEAYRALDAGDRARFERLTSDWPRDVRSVLLARAEDAFGALTG